MVTFDHKLNIVVVDDDKGDVELLRRQLSHVPGLEFALCHLGDTDTAVREIRKRNPDIVFIDYRLGKTTGIVVLRTLRQSGCLVPVIFVSGAGNELLVAEALREGADDYVTKSNSSIDVLGRAMRHALTQQEKRRAEDKLQLIQFSIDHASDSVFWVCKDGHFDYVNHCAYRSLGYERDEMLALNVTDIAPDVSSQWPDLWQQLKRDGSLQREGMHQRKDGSTFPVEVDATYVHFGCYEHGCAFVRDITARKQADNEKETLNRKLVDLSREAGMAEVATGVLHNVGNVLNSVNVSANCMTDQLRASKVTRLVKACQLMNEHADDLSEFFTCDEKGKRLPGYFTKLATLLTGERDSLSQELASLSEHVGHIKDIVAMQQSFGRVSGVEQQSNPIEIAEDAIKINSAGLARHEVELIREYDDDLPPITTDKHKVLQILVNLISNAKYAIDDTTGRRVTIRVCRTHEDAIEYQVEDTGVGISCENMARLFSHGFTTRDDGHGFGLHSSALAAKKLVGTLTAQSDGPGKGAMFTLSLPINLETNAIVELEQCVN